MLKSNAKITREKIVFTAFIQFSLKPYEKVTYDDFVETGFSRGTILHHFKTKKAIFNAVIEFSFSTRTSILNIPVGENDCLKNFIFDFVKSCQEAQKKMASYGILNINRSVLNLENQAFYHYDNFEMLSKQNQQTEIKVWHQVINKAIASNEINAAIDPELMATIFYQTYLGHSYKAVSNKYGCDVDILRKDLMGLYEIVKYTNQVSTN